MKRVYAVFLAFVFCQFSQNLSAQADVPIYPNSSPVNGESSLALDPLNPNHLVVAWMYYALNSNSLVIAVAHSTNSGTTWYGLTTIPHSGPGRWSADPSLCFKNDGSLYLAYIDYKKPAVQGGSTDSGAVYVRKSVNGGYTWGGASKVIDLYSNNDRPIDRPWITVDNTVGTYSGNVYVVTKSLKDDTIPHHMYFMRSINGGVNWSSPKLVDSLIPCGPNIKSMGVPAVTKTGKLCIAYSEYSPGNQPRFAAAYSTDGGATLTNSYICTYTSAVVTETLLQLSYCLSSSPTLSNNLVLVFNNKLTADFDVSCVSSSNGGGTWTPVQRICDNAQGNGNHQDMVWGAYSSSGVYAAIWRDRRANNGAEIQPYKIWGRVSFNGGITFSPEFQLSQTDGPLVQPTDGNDFIGCVVRDSTVYSSWADGRVNPNSNQLYINKFQSSLITSLAGTTADEREILFPNPNNGNFTIEFGTEENRKIEISDLAGKIIYSAWSDAKKLEIHLKEKPGNYFVKITTGKKEKVLNMLME